MGRLTKEGAPGTTPDLSAVPPAASASAGAAAGGAAGGTPRPAVGMTRWMQALRGKLADHPVLTRLQRLRWLMGGVGFLVGLGLAVRLAQRGATGGALALAGLAALAMGLLAWLMTTCGLLAIAPAEFLNGEAGQAFVQRWAAGRPPGVARLLFALEALLAAILLGGLLAVS